MSAPTRPYCKEAGALGRDSSVASGSLGWGSITRSAISLRQGPGTRVERVHGGRRKFAPPVLECSVPNPVRQRHDLQYRCTRPGDREVRVETVQIKCKTGTGIGKLVKSRENRLVFSANGPSVLWVDVKHCDAI
ncbi:hypothetical protein ZHAS_00015279 [Anopheles sinensis]|uniref:Uncharacterized protein n=1 Tax=Anopheles sinensis TaxID=74873 RepID=A0A084WAL1_ANOSI|nr:hypothetical protein ZHAS_00015279 [Anopheles sinensis]